jgi:hypothetical protein
VAGQAGALAVDKHWTKSEPAFVHRLSTGSKPGFPVKPALQVIEVKKKSVVVRISTGLTVIVLL